MIAADQRDPTDRNVKAIGRPVRPTESSWPPSGGGSRTPAGPAGRAANDFAADAILLAPSPSGEGWGEELAPS